MRWKGTSIVVSVVATLALTAPASPARAVLTTAVCDDAWHVEDHPQDGQVLEAVSSRWIQGAWAVGWVFDDARSVRRTYIEHWNGTGWKRIASPNVDPRTEPGNNQLFGVVGIGADIWAVGRYVDPGDATHPVAHLPLVMHYGGSGWSVVHSDPTTGEATLRDVWQAPGGDVWAVGQSWDGAHPVAERWDGVAWHDVPVPDPSTSLDGFAGVSGSGTDDLWAVGSAAGGTEPLVGHWNGLAWSRVAAEDPDAERTALADVGVRRDGAAIAVGSFDPTGATRDRTLAEQWSAGAWGTMVTPNPGSSRDVLLGVDRRPHNLQKYWAVGWREGSTGARRPLILRLGARWRVDPAPNPYPGGWTELMDVAVFGRDTFDAVGAVAVGRAYDPAAGASRSVIMRRCAP